MDMDMQNDLLQLIIEKYSEQRNKFNHYVSNPNEVEEILIEELLKQVLQQKKF